MLTLTATDENECIEIQLIALKTILNIAFKKGKLISMLPWVEVAFKFSAIAQQKSGFNLEEIDEYPSPTYFMEIYKQLHIVPDTYVC